MSRDSVVRMTKTHTDSDEKCRKAQENVAHVVSDCSTLVQTLYLARHNAALKILFFDILRDYQLADAILPWYSSVQPKPVKTGKTRR